MQNNPYQSPAPAAAATDKPPPKILPKVGAMFFRHSLVVLAFTLILLFVVPGYVRQWEAANWRLPAPSLLLLLLSRHAANNWNLLILAAPVYYGILFIDQVIERRVLGWVIIWPLFFWFGVAFCVYIVSVGLLAPSLMNAPSGAGS